MSKIACVAVVKNEERHIAEWIAYQLAIGFDAVILMDNVSTDGTQAVARCCAGLFDVRVVAAPDTGVDYQKSAYLEAIRLFGPEFEWLAFFDADEYLVLDGPLGLREVLAQHADAAAIGVNWAMFGSAGHQAAPAGLVIENFQRRGGVEFGPSRHIKSIIRPSQVSGFYNGHMFKTQSAYRDLAGREITFASPGVIAHNPDYRGGRLHHYFTLSREEWVAKLKRGYPDLERKMSEFEIYDLNDFADDEAARLAPRVKEIMAAVAAKKTIKCGVVLVVKDEIHDIPAWLAWYHAIGFDTCIVFDDYSTDGTWEFLQQAALVQDIRLSRTKGPVSVRYQIRQQDSYRFALAQYQDEFEWLAFFDADELLLLQHDEDVKSFLGRFADAEAVAVNWCNYGSSGHLLKPDGLMFEAFTWHSDERQDINRHVKSFVRPKKNGGRQINVHYFDVDPEKYFLANGEKVQWSETPGIIAADPDWGVAKLMHYQCRSMEHFIERMKKRPNLAVIPALWECSNVNQVQDLSPLRYAAKVKAQIEIFGRKKESVMLDLPAPTEKLGAQNISLHRPATQSSISEWSYQNTAERDAAGAVNGVVDGLRKFHTAREINPWWQVDLGAGTAITEIRIYNTVEAMVRERFVRFSIAIGFDADSFVEVYRKEDDTPVGGVDSAPFIWRPAFSAWGRLVRITLLGDGFLHLDQVEVYGEPVAAVVVAKPEYSSIPNPLGAQGFIIGWEGAALGNRLSCFGNLFALSERTGVPVAFRQITTAGNLLDMESAEYPYIHGKLSPEHIVKMAEMAAYAGQIFNAGYDAYKKTYQTLALRDLARLDDVSGVVVFADIPSKIQDMQLVEAQVKEFCGRGNGMILGGAFWRHYLDMRVVAPYAAPLRQALRIRHEDKAGGRALAMRQTGEDCLRIGVHMRRTDYAGWYGGKYFFSVAQYAALMQNIHAGLGGRKHYFCVCSDEVLDAAVFGGLPVWYEKGTQEDDFTALSKCHVVAGPPSTFGTWAAFLGRGKRLVLTQARMANPAAWQNPLSDAVEVLYPTGAYLPGDPAAGPL